MSLFHARLADGCVSMRFPRVFTLSTFNPGVLKSSSPASILPEVAADVYQREIDTVEHRCADVDNAVSAAAEGVVAVMVIFAPDNLLWLKSSKLSDPAPASVPAGGRSQIARGANCRALFAPSLCHHPYPSISPSFRLH
jgi:hypothetical protein